MVHGDVVEAAAKALVAASDLAENADTSGEIATKILRDMGPTRCLDINTEFLNWRTGHARPEGPITDPDFLRFLGYYIERRCVRCDSALHRKLRDWVGINEIACVDMIVGMDRCDTITERKEWKFNRNCRVMGMLNVTLLSSTYTFILAHDWKPIMYKQFWDDRKLGSNQRSVEVLLMQKKLDAMLKRIEVLRMRYVDENPDGYDYIDGDSFDGEDFDEEVTL